MKTTTGNDTSTLPAAAAAPSLKQSDERISRDEIIKAHPIVDYLRAQGHTLKKAGANFETNACPAGDHKEGHRPVTIYTATQSWNCHDHKIGGTVIDWVMTKKNLSASDAMLFFSGKQNSSELKRQLKDIYDYTDEKGKLLFQTCRYQPKDFRQRQPDGKGGYIWNLKGVRRVLYRLPEVIEARTVVIVEGEKDADNLNSLGFTATTNPMGAGTWRDKFSEVLHGKDVVVFGDIGDSDKNGEKHTQQVLQSVNGKVNSLKHAIQPNGFHDISDYIASLPAERATETIRKLIDETPEVDFQSGNFARVDEPAPAELPAPPRPYIPPPLDLLPLVLQDYVHAAAEALNVDVVFPLLPLLCSVGTSVGNSRSIILKRGFIQPPVIWTGIIGPSGSRKSPGIEAGCFPVMEHERELMWQNKQAREQYDEEISQWESKKGEKTRGRKPEEPSILTCVCDDLTMEVLADRLSTNPRGLLVSKDELSHWLASFDQYKNARGSDVSRWLSLHTGVFVAVDRRSDKRHYRFFLPRVCITGGIQPKVFRRILTPDYFERGLPARFLLAYPPFRQDRWSEATVPDVLRTSTLELFEKLWLLHPEHDDQGQPRPKLLILDKNAKTVFVDFYNDCGTASLEAGEHEEAAWCKLTGYGARLALAGQLARDPKAEIITGEVMQAACALARWFGNEAVRIYAELAETTEQRRRRELIEFIERRGGSVSVRETTQFHWPLRGQRDEAERQLGALVRNGFGKWFDDKGSRGPAARKFQSLQVSTSTGFGKIRGENEKPVDVESGNSQKITPLGEPELKPVSAKESAKEPADIMSGDDPEGETIL